MTSVLFGVIAGLCLAFLIVRGSRGNRVLKARTVTGNANLGDVGGNLIQSCSAPPPAPAKGGGFDVVNVIAMVAGVASAVFAYLSLPGGGH
ncbi:MAG: hypothetical protein WCJ64_03385 [Rhodospirillaceae bacterium]